MAPIELKLNSCWAMHGSGVYFASDTDIPQHASWRIYVIQPPVCIIQTFRLADLRKPQLSTNYSSETDLQPSMGPSEVRKVL